MLNIRLGLNGSIKLQTNKEEAMGTAIEFQKLMTEIIYINLPGPTEPTPGMSGGELLHGFLSEIYNAPNVGVKYFVDTICLRWNIRYRERAYSSHG